MKIKRYPKKKHSSLQRALIMTVEEFLPLINSRGEKFLYEGAKVRLDSSRLRTFQQNQHCVVCGIQGTFFALEKPIKCDNRYWHFSLYAIDAIGEEVLLTKDHIIPASKGGKSNVENLQTMCKPCNELKGDTVYDSSVYRTPDQIN